MAKYILAAVLWRQRRILQRALANRRREAESWNRVMLDWERQIADLTAAIDAALEDGVDYMADRASHDSSTTTGHNS